MGFHVNLNTLDMIAQSLNKSPSVKAGAVQCEQGQGPFQRLRRGGTAITPRPFGRGHENHAERYVARHNPQLEQSALGSQTTMQMMKDWRKLKPELFRKQSCHLSGCDSYFNSEDQGKFTY